MGMNYFGKTDIGKRRETNQDFFLIRELDENNVLMVVCDGMGGTNGGSEASRIAAESFVSYVERHFEKEKKDEYLSVLEGALGCANENVSSKAKSSKDYEGMGTTLVCAIFDGESYYCLWVGDSRRYAIADNGLLQISHDHSFVQSLVDNGSITREEARTHPNRNIITKAVGTEGVISGDVCKINADKTNGLLLCSDGLCGYVEEEIIFEILKKESDSEKRCDMLVEAANAAGGIDNVTVIVHNNR